MSLLMEALKKSEEAKRLTGDGRTQDAPPNSPLPDLALHLDAIDSELASASKRSSEPDSKPMQAEKERIEADDRKAANNLFTAKQSDNRKHRLFPLLALALLITFAVGAYFWWQLRTLPTQTLAVPPAPPPMPAAANIVPQPGYNTPASLVRNDNTAGTEARTARISRADAKAQVSSAEPPIAAKGKARGLLVSHSRHPVDQNPAACQSTTRTCLRGADCRTNR